MMNAPETMKLCRVVAAGCPAQRFDEETPAVWHALLVDIPIGDALEAFKTIARQRPFVAPSDIIGEVKRMRRARIASAGDADGIVPNVDPDHELEFRAERRAIMAAAAAGDLDADAYARGGFTFTGVTPMRALGDVVEGKSVGDVDAFRALAASFGLDRALEAELRESLSDADRRSRE